MATSIAALLSRLGRWQRPLLGALLLLLLLPLLWLSATRALAAGAHYFLERQLQAWSLPAAPPSMEEWRYSEQLLHFAEDFIPKNPRLMAHAAQLYDWRAWLEQEERAVRTHYLELSLEYHRRGLRSRPAWPYSWADFAAAKARRGLLDEEFQAAYATAARLGPWEVGVQSRLIEIGLPNWRQLNRESRDTLVATLQRALAVQERTLFSSVERIDELPRLCFLLQQDARVHAYCESKHIY